MGFPELPILGVGVAPMAGIRPAGVGCFLLNKVDMVVTAIGVGVGPNQGGMKMDSGAHQLGGMMVLSGVGMMLVPIGVVIMLHNRVGRLSSVAH